LTLSINPRCCSECLVGRFEHCQRQYQKPLLVNGHPHYCLRQEIEPGLELKQKPLSPKESLQQRGLALSLLVRLAYSLYQPNSQHWLRWPDCYSQEPHYHQY
jgi:hypothetical protein